MPLTHVTDHADQGDALLIEQYKNKPRISALLASYTGEVQALEDAIYDVIIKRLIDNAADAQLDTIGSIVGENRRGHDDATYRLFITVRIRVNRSKGEPADVLAILALLDPTTRTFDEVRVANLVFEFATPTALSGDELLAIMRDAKGGGIGLLLIVPTTSDSAAQWGDVDTASDVMHGLGDVDTPTTTGLLSIVYA